LSFGPVNTPTRRGNWADIEATTFDALRDDDGDDRVFRDGLRGGVPPEVRLCFFVFFTLLF